MWQKPWDDADHVDASKSACKFMLLISLASLLSRPLTKLSKRSQQLLLAWAKLQLLQKRTCPQEDRGNTLINKNARRSKASDSFGQQKAGFSSQAQANPLFLQPWDRDTVPSAGHLQPRIQRSPTRRKRESTQPHPFPGKATCGRQERTQSLCLP